jgi:hypothetical protein
MSKIIIFLFISLTAGLLLANLYSSIVDAPNWNANIPASVQAARDHFASANPGSFFRIFSPLNQFMGFLTLVIFWNTSKRARLFFILAFVFAIGADIFTFTYFYPRNTILFEGPLTNVEEIRRASSQWVTMNWLRSGVVLVALVFAWMGLNEVYEKERPALQM